MNRWGNILVIATIIAAVALAVAFPGSTSFSGDEAGFLNRAISANARGELEPLGPVGSFGNTYGPLPIHVDQLLLLLTRDLSNMVAIHALLISAGSAGVLWLLAGMLGARRSFIPVVIAAPWFWYYSRIIWGNPLWLLTSCLMFLAYARWCRQPTRANAMGWSAAAAIMPAIHPSGLALPLAAWLAAIFACRTQLRRTALWVILGTLVALAPSARYIWFTCNDFHHRWTNPRPPIVVPGTTQPADLFKKSTRAGRLESATFAFRGAVLLSAEQRFYQPLRQSATGRFLQMTGPISRFTHLWFFIGFGLAVAELWRRHTRTNTAAGDGQDSRLVILGMAITAVLLQAILFAFIRVNWHEHYLAATFVAITVICWVGFDALCNGRWTRWLAIVPAIASVVTTVVLAVVIHRSDGAGSSFSPNVRNLEELARELRGSDASKAWTDSPQLAYTPQSLRAARRLIKRKDGVSNTQKSEETHLIRQRHSGEGWLMIDRTRTDMVGMQPIDIRDD